MCQFLNVQNIRFPGITGEIIRKSEVPLGKTPFQTQSTFVRSVFA